MTLEASTTIRRSGERRTGRTLKINMLFLGAKFGRFVEYSILSLAVAFTL